MPALNYVCITFCVLSCFAGQMLRCTQAGMVSTSALFAPAVLQLELGMHHLRKLHQHCLCAGNADGHSRAPYLLQTGVSEAIEVMNLIPIVVLIQSCTLMRWHHPEVA